MWYIPLYHTIYTTKSLYNNKLHKEKVCIFATENGRETVQQPAAVFRAKTV